MDPTVLTTRVHGLSLRAHLPDDAQALVDVLALNAEHLMGSGDYGAEIATTVARWRLEFGPYAEGRTPAYSFGMWIDDQMVGRIVLLPVDPPRYGLGYWVTESQQGKGVASAAVAAIVEHARTIGASDVFAGVNHGNDASMRVLLGSGFQVAEDFACYTRFRRHLA
jgi:RimJ/RimL family protein N-acetyltransferase